MRIRMVLAASLLLGCGGGSSPQDGSMNDMATGGGSMNDMAMGGDGGGGTVTTLASVALPARPNGGSVYDPGTKLIFVGLYNSASPPTSGGIAVIDTTTNQLKTTITTSLIVGGMAINTVTHKIYATAQTFTGQSMPTVYVVDPATQTVSATFNPGSAG